MRQKCKDCMLCGIDRVTDCYYCLAYEGLSLPPRPIKKISKKKLNRFNSCPNFRKRLYSSGIMWEVRNR